MREIPSDQLVSVALTTVANLHNIKKAYKLNDGREALYIASLKTRGISLGKQIGDGVKWVKQPLPPLRSAF